MTKHPQRTFADKEAMLVRGRGEPLIVHPRQTARKGSRGALRMDEAQQAAVKARSYAIERGLGDWIRTNTGPGDHPALAVALLRMAVNQHIGVGEQAAMEFLHEMFPRPAFDA